MIIVTYGIQNSRHVIFLYIDVMFVFRTEVFLFLLLECPSGNQRKCQGERKRTGENKTEKKINIRFFFLMLIYERSIYDLSMLSSILLKFSTFDVYFVIIMLV